MYDANTIQQLLTNTQARMLALVDTLTESQRDVPYHAGINPPVWEMGHSAFFYEWFILKALDGLPTENPALDDVWDSFQLAHRDRWSKTMFPDYLTTREYSLAVFNKTQDRLNSKPLTPDDLYLYRYAIYHQNMHIESMIWARQTLAYPPPPSFAQEPKSGLTEQPMSHSSCSGDAEIPSDVFLLGMAPTPKDFATQAFCFDNEKPRFRKNIPSFSISKTLVSCGEFLAFVEDGGYGRTDFWSQGGKRWLKKPRPWPEPTEVALNAPRDAGNPPRHPRYWRQQSDGWEVRFFDRWQPLIPEYPMIHLSYWEAEAYCHWAGRRLPEEHEWEAAALNNRQGSTFNLFPWGNQGPAGRADMDGVQLAQQPVTAFTDGNGEDSLLQAIGTCWEWTASQFFPYDGFSMDMYPFMSTLQFGDHKATRGGSCATSSCLIRGTYRQAYHPDRDDIFVGFRTCALD